MIESKSLRSGCCHSITKCNLWQRVISIDEIEFLWDWGWTLKQVFILRTKHSESRERQTWRWRRWNHVFDVWHDHLREDSKSNDNFVGRSNTVLFCAVHVRSGFPSSWRLRSMCCDGLSLSVVFATFFDLRKDLEILTYRVNEMERLSEIQSPSEVWSKVVVDHAHLESEAT